jgi:glutathione S-transferase
VHDQYVIHGAPFSLFTRKLEAALRFYGAPFRNETKAIGGEDEAGRRAGTHQVPVLQTPENWMVADTTPLLDLLDARYPARRLFPEGPLGVLVHIVEEVLDEWVARVMVHYRWHHAENTRHIVSRVLGRDVSLEEAQAFPLAQWGPRACRATGTETEHQQEAAEAEYTGLLSALEEQLGRTRYALGDRPCAADTILLGGLRAHTNADPVPDLGAFPRCTSWDERDADPWQGDGRLAPFPESTPFAAHVLKLARDQYAPFVLANAEALTASQKAFTIETHGAPASYLARPYPEQSRRMLQERIRHRLAPAERRQVLTWLEASGLAAAFAP